LQKGPLPNRNHIVKVLSTMSSDGNVITLVARTTKGGKYYYKQVGVFKDPSNRNALYFRSGRLGLTDPTQITFEEYNSLMND